MYGFPTPLPEFLRHGIYAGDYVSSKSLEMVQTNGQATTPEGGAFDEFTFCQAFSHFNSYASQI
jgi:hypothetical protein